MKLFNYKNNNTVDKNSEKLYASSRSFQSAGTKCADGRYVSAEELYDFIADFFKPLLEQQGFKYLKSKKTFKRATQDGCDEIAFWFNDHVHYHLDFIFYKRIDSLQKIITSVEFETGLNTISDYKQHHTVWVCYGNIFDSIEIVSYSILKKELPEVLTFIENKILPYFDKLNSVNFVHQTLNYPENDKDNPFSYFAIKGSYDNSMITGLIIAKILKDPNYDILLNKCLTKNPQNMILKKELTKLNDYLKQKKLEI
jgi:hypothetical protein